MIGAAWNIWELFGPPSSTINAGKPKDKKSGPGERTIGGAVLAKAWKAAWVKPFVMFAVFDKTVSGDWTLVHIHFSV